MTHTPNSDAPAPRPRKGQPNSRTDAPPEQWFFFAAWRFAIHTAQQLIQATPRDPVQIEAGPWARAYGLVPRAPGSIPLIGATDFDPDYAMTTNLAEPLILATIRSTGQAGAAHCSHLLIDGCHRIYRAHSEARTHLPGYLLTVEESLTIRRHARALRR